MTPWGGSWWDSLVSLEKCLRWLSASGDPLERLRAAVDFDALRVELEAALPRADRDRGGRSSWDATPMFHVLVLQALYTLSYDQAEYQLRDRLCFMRFVGPVLHEIVPDAKPIWLYRQQFTQAGALAQLFTHFGASTAVAQLHPLYRHRSNSSPHQVLLHGSAA